MSIAFSGSKSRSRGVIDAIIKQLKSVNFKPAKKITVEFDPFDEKSHKVRRFLNYCSAPKYTKTNPACIFKTNIICDRSEPTVTIDLVSGGKVVMKCNNLSVLELLQLYNKHVTSLVPPEPEEENLDVKSKLKNKKSKKR